MAESVNILIQAEDRATPKIQSASQSLDNVAKRVKEVGGQTKATTELVGTLANALGGTAFGQFAGQLAQLTERVSAFSDVSKSGAAGALALRAGIYAAGAVASYKIAESIAGWYFEAAKWRREMEAADRAAAKTSETLANARQKTFSQGREDVELVRDPGQREQAAQDRINALDGQASSLDAKIASQRKKLLEAQKQYDSSILPFGSDARKAAVDAEQLLLDDLLSMQSDFRGEADAMREAYGERAKRIAQIKEENALADKSDQFIKSLNDEIEMLRATEDERRKLEAARNAAPGDQSMAESLIAERDKLRQQQKDAEESRKEIERIAQLEKDELSRLEEKKILLREGAEAAEIFRLKQQGLSEETAKMLVNRNAELDKQLALNNFQLPVNQALESRTLTRGPAETIQQKILDESKKQTEQQVLTNQYLKNIPLGPSNLTKIEVVN